MSAAPEGTLRRYCKPRYVLLPSSSSFPSIWAPILARSRFASTPKVPCKHSSVEVLPPPGSLSRCLSVFLCVFLSPQFECLALSTRPLCLSLTDQGCRSLSLPRGTWMGLAPALDSLMGLPALAIRPCSTLLFTEEVPHLSVSQSPPPRVRIPYLDPARAT